MARVGSSESPYGSAPPLPFAHLNLRNNPFGELDAADRLTCAVVDVKAMAAKLRCPGVAVQLMGERGHGKTTHLLAMRRLLGDVPYVHVPEGKLPRIPRGPLLLLDEAQRLPPRIRTRLFRRCTSLAIGTHEDFQRELTDGGFNVQTVRPSNSLTAGRLHQIIQARIEGARRAPGPLPTVGLDRVRQLRDQFGGDVRGIVGTLYESFQDMARTQHAEV